eukprot:TRINITY_DN48120_c0_g1_i1.p1 TRINITY_DN48120_c0_g1~~TRINITY_DN48120_c0_g1_i1.p1  ORF type:complete len:653 (-),score=108.89 TRINITY_DN48120_c0_g1_i1:93-2051(-)
MALWHLCQSLFATSTAQWTVVWPIAADAFVTDVQVSERSTSELSRTVCNSRTDAALAVEGTGFGSCAGAESDLDTVHRPEDAVLAKPESAGQQSPTSFQVCHGPAGGLDDSSGFACFSLLSLYRFRVRLVRHLTQTALPGLILGSVNVQKFEKVVQVDSRLQPAMRLGSKRCSRPPRMLHLVLAVICAGLLEEEDISVRGLVDGRLTHLADAAWKALRGVLQCPWARLAATGWPVFALLARYLRRIFTTSQQCPSHAQYPLAVERLFRQGLPPDLQVPPRELAVAVGAVALFGDGFSRGLQSLHGSGATGVICAAICFWEAADRRSLPHGKICVTVLKPDQMIAADTPLATLGARHRNPWWPGCENGTVTGETAAAVAASGGLQKGDGRLGGQIGSVGASKMAADATTMFWMAPPLRRDVASDAIRESQRPYCTVNHKGRLMAEVDRLLARALPGQRPVHAVEVGTTFGDCTLSVHAVASMAAVPFRATVFEANPETVPILRKNLAINGASTVVQVHQRVVANASRNKWEFAVPVSSVHAFATGMRENETIGGVTRLYEVVATTLDEELIDDDVDVLMLSLNGFEVEVLAGAKNLLASRRIAAVISLTRRWTDFRNLLLHHGYIFEEEVHFHLDVWSLARAPTRSPMETSSS